MGSGDWNALADTHERGGDIVINISDIQDSVE